MPYSCVLENTVQLRKQGVKSKRSESLVYNAETEKSNIENVIL